MQIFCNKSCIWRNFSPSFGYYLAGMLRARRPPQEISGISVGFLWLLVFHFYLSVFLTPLYIIVVLNTQRFDVLVPKIVIYNLCYLLNCKKKRRCLKLTSPLEIAANVAEFNKHKFRNYAYYNQFQNWCNKSANSIAQITCTRASIPQCLRVVFLIRGQSYYFFLNCANIFGKKQNYVLNKLQFNISFYENRGSSKNHKQKIAIIMSIIQHNNSSIVIIFEG